MKNAQCIFRNLDIKEVSFYVSHRGNHFHIVLIYELDAPLWRDNPSFKADHNIKRTGSQTCDLRGPPQNFLALSQCLLMLLANALNIFFLSLQKPLLFPFMPAIARSSLNKHNFFQKLSIFQLTFG